MIDLDGIRIKQHLMDDDSTSVTAITGRRRLVGIQMQVKATQGRYRTASPLEDNLVKLSNGGLADGGAPVLFQVGIPRASSASYKPYVPTTVMLGGRTILFDDGIWVNEIANSGVQNIQGAFLKVVIYYV